MMGATLGCDVVGVVEGDTEGLELVGPCVG